LSSFLELDMLHLTYENKLSMLINKDATADGQDPVTRSTPSRLVCSSEI
jgi:hypothetical protein